MGAIPSGTVCFLFTDVVASTRLWEDHPSEMAPALAAHDELLAEAIERHRGYVFSRSGDSFAAAFPTVPEALLAACTAQEALTGSAWSHGVQIAVRMGLHAGSAEERQGDYYGPALNRCARLMALAHGGQVLLSGAAEQLVRDQLPGGLSLLSLGVHRLRGLDRAETVFQLAGRGLVEQFPPLRSGLAPPGNLAQPLTSFIGRVDELKHLVAEVAGHRLVSLTGPGGVGKTRLANEVAWASSELFPDGSWWVELSPLAEPDAVVHAVAQALRARPQEGADLAQAVVEAVADRRLLIVLDNCEHVLPAARRLVERLVAGAPRVCVLATTREPLALPGERVWPVAGLDPSLEGVELFCERARDADPSFDADDRAAIAELCARLDGMPLAIELAAARARSISPADLVARLADRFRVLRGGAGRPTRHQTLRAAVEWSHQLLGPAEATLFERLAVFAGTFDLAAVEAICGFEPIDPLDVVEGMSALVDKSLVSVERRDGSTRYRLLETLRAFGSDRLAAAGTAELLHRRHVAHYASVAARARADYEGRANARGAATFEAEWDDLRAATRRAVADGDAAAASTLVRAPFWFSYLNMRHELADWAREALTLPDVSPDVAGVAAVFAWAEGNLDEAARLVERGARSPSRPGDLGVCLHGLGVVHWWAGRPAEAYEATRQGLADALASGDRFMLATSYSLVALFGARPHPAEAAEAIDRARQIADELANPALRAWVETNVGVAEFAIGRRAGGIVALRRGEELAARTSTYLQAVARMSLATVAASPETGIPPERAYALAVERLAAVRAWPQLWTALESLAAYWADKGRLGDAGVVVGHLERLDRRFGPLAARRARTEHLLSTDAAAAHARARGAAMGRAELVEFVLASLAGEPDDQRGAGTSSA